MSMRLISVVLFCCLAGSVSAQIPQGRIVTDLSGTCSLETSHWQAAIDAAAKAGGGVVTMPAGRHRTGTLFLKSNVTLELAEGCVLEGSSDIADYPDIHLKYAEIREPWQALVAAEGQTNVAVVGKGEIFGNGAAFPFDSRLGRPRGMLFKECRNVRVEGIRMRDLASWTCYYKECDGVVHRRVRVDSHANVNADGVDIESRNVLVEDCEIDCDDDGIVLKSDNPDFLVENVEVRHCEVRSCCSLFKLGTASHGGFRNIRFHDLTGGAARREVIDPKTGNGILSDYRAQTWPGATVKPAPISGIAIECVDGGLVEDVVFKDVAIREATTPIFVRGGLRYGRKWGNKVDLGIPFGRHKVLRNVLLENVTATAKSFVASSVTGVEGLRLSGITFRNVELNVPGAGEAARPELDLPVPENPSAYPESNMFDHRMLPACGLYVRHVDGLKLERVRINVKGEDPRLRIVLEDVGKSSGGLSAEKQAEFRKIAEQAMVTPVVDVTPAAKYLEKKQRYCMNSGFDMTPKGRIWTSWVGGEDGARAFLVQHHSDDGGKTWSETDFVIDPHVREKKPDYILSITSNFWTDPGGRLHFFFDQSMGCVGKDPRGRTHMDGRAGIWEIVSENPDDAKPIWSPPRRIGDGHALSKPIVAKDGTWYLPVCLDPVGLAAYPRRNSFRAAYRGRHPRRQGHDARLAGRRACRRLHGETPMIREGLSQGRMFA